MQQGAILAALPERVSIAAMCANAALCAQDFCFKIFQLLPSATPGNMGCRATKLFR
jgi:hypothetical protein